MSFLADSETGGKAIPLAIGLGRALREMSVLSRLEIYSGSPAANWNRE
jgi:hypothetical protein